MISSATVPVTKKTIKWYGGDIVRSDVIGLRRILYRSGSGIVVDWSITPIIDQLWITVAKRNRLADRVDSTSAHAKHSKTNKRVRRSFGRYFH